MSHPKGKRQGTARSKSCCMKKPNQAAATNTHDERHFSVRRYRVAATANSTLPRRQIQCRLIRIPFQSRAPLRVAREHDADAATRGQRRAKRGRLGLPADPFCSATPDEPERIDDQGRCTGFRPRIPCSVSRGRRPYRRRMTSTTPDEAERIDGQRRCTGFRLRKSCSVLRELVPPMVSVKLPENVLVVYGIKLLID